MSKAAREYHPGRGVYRSSYKNALRMTAIETNMAYRIADHESWKAMPFVLGIIVKTSQTNHEQDDMCDSLQGEYPKEFKFTGWHPHCRCYATAKLASLDELNKYSQLTDEEQQNYQFKGKVDKMPKNFTDWIKENTYRIQNAESLPHFITDNFTGGDLSKSELWIPKSTMLETIKQNIRFYPSEIGQKIDDLVKSGTSLKLLNAYLKNIEENISHSVKHYGKVFAEGNYEYSKSDVIDRLMNA